MNCVVKCSDKNVLKFNLKKKIFKGKYVIVSLWWMKLINEFDIKGNKCFVLFVFCVGI